MSEIPEDIFATARTLADDAATFGYTQAALDIARALKARDERAAKIAEAMDTDGRSNWGAVVAARIREGGRL